MQIWKIMFCELLIFTITISRYGYSMNVHVHFCCMYTIFKFVKYCKILISCTNSDQIPYFCQVYIPDIYIRCMQVKLIVHTRIHCITSSQVKCFLSACVHHLFVGRTSRSKTLRLGKMQYP